MADETPRISASELRQKLSRGDDTLLVCAYEDAEACRQHSIPGALHLDALQQRLADLDPQQEIVFYCA